MESSLLPISGNTGLNVNVLFPLDPLRILASFTASPPTSTVPSSLSTRLEHVSLSDNALGIHKVSSRTSHFLVVPPEYHHTEYPSDASLELDFDHKYCSQDARCKELAWEASFPQGSINPSNRAAPAGGFGFYLRGTETFAAQLKDAEEVLMSYEMMFEEGWMWGKGGKLPGIYGGVGDEAYGCTGGRTKERYGLGELYAYLAPTEPNVSRLLNVQPRSLQNPDYGFSVGRGAWTFEAGRWTAIAQRVRMNMVGKEDGEIEVYIDGRSVICITGLVFRTEESRMAHVHGLHFQTFFGGNKPDWASPRDQKAWFRKVSGAILRRSNDSTPHVHDEL